MNKYIQAIRKHLESKAGYKYEDVRTGEIYTYKRKGLYKKNGRILVFRGTANKEKE